MQGEIDVLDVVSDRGREINAALQADTLVALSSRTRSTSPTTAPCWSRTSASPAPASSAR
jgi:hypothetical protein